MSNGDTSETYLDAGLTIASTLAFGLEGPVGLFFAGVLQALPMLLFGQDAASSDKAFAQELSTALSEALTEQNVDNAREDIQKVANWLETAISVIDGLDVSLLEANLVGNGSPGLMHDVYDNTVHANAPLVTDMGTLSDSSVLQDPLVGATALSLLMSAASLFFLFHVKRVQWDLWLLQNAKGGPGIPTVPDVIVDYVWAQKFMNDATIGWGPKINAALDALTSHRLAQVSAVTYVAGLPPALHGYYTYTDQGNEQGEWVALEGPNPGLQQQAQTAHDQYVAKLDGQLQAQYAPHRATLASWQLQLANAGHYLTPEPPGPPQILDLSKWGSTSLPSPPGPWVDGAQVRYAVKYSNEGGTEVQGPWSAPVTITDHSEPAVHVPYDPTGITDTRHILRQIGPDLHQAPIYLVGEFPDNAPDDPTTNNGNVFVDSPESAYATNPAAYTPGEVAATIGSAHIVIGGAQCLHTIRHPYAYTAAWEDVVAASLQDQANPGGAPVDPGATRVSTDVHIVPLFRVEMTNGGEPYLAVRHADDTWDPLTPIGTGQLPGVIARVGCATVCLDTHVTALTGLPTAPAVLHTVRHSGSFLPWETVASSDPTVTAILKNPGGGLGPNYLASVTRAATVHAFIDSGGALWHAARLSNPRDGSGTWSGWDSVPFGAPGPTSLESLAAAWTTSDQKLHLFVADTAGVIWHLIEQGWSDPPTWAGWSQVTLNGPPSAAGLGARGNSGDLELLVQDPGGGLWYASSAAGQSTPWSEWSAAENVSAETGATAPGGGVALA